MLIRLHTEFFWLSSETHSDRLSKQTAASVRRTICWNFEWKFPENPSFPSYCVLLREGIKCARARCKTCPFICNVEKLLGPKRSTKITDHFTMYLYLSHGHLLYKLHSLQKVIHRRNRETTRRQIPRTPSRRRERRQKRI